MDLLGDEAAPGAPTPAADWNGVTFAINVQSEAELRAMLPLLPEQHWLRRSFVGSGAA